MSIILRGHFMLAGDDNKARNPSLSEGEQEQLAELLFSDVQHGTYGPIRKLYKFRDELNGFRDLRANSWVRATEREGILEFQLELHSSMFDFSQGGIQHLVGVLAGDMFDRQSSFGNIREPFVREVDLSTESPDLLNKMWRAGARATANLNEIRRMLALEEDYPLLAFSLKPRFGLDWSSMREITRGVLQVGFQIVEMDTREVPTRATANEFMQMVKIASELDPMKHFSINLSLPPSDALALAEQVVRLRRKPPYVFKVDGTLDGFATMQALRGKYGDDVIITCYPLLRGCMHGRVPREFLNTCLWASGADIIYPGGRPSIGPDLSIDAAKKGFVKATKSYADIVKEGRFMPTIAGGVHLGHLHAFYEVVGPHTGFFLGGAVALHPDGAIAGAALCAKTIHEAVKLRRRRRQTNGLIEDLSDATIKEIDDAVRRSGMPGDPEKCRYTYWSLKEFQDKFPTLFER
jgi:hypothetical protein